MDVFLQILEGNGHERTQREGLCTGTAKSEPRYDIYLEQTAVYWCIGISLQPYYAEHSLSNYWFYDPVMSLPM